MKTPCFITVYVHVSGLVTVVFGCLLCFTQPSTTSLKAVIVTGKLCHYSIQNDSTANIT